MSVLAKFQIFYHEDPESAEAVTECHGVGAKISVIGAGVNTCELTQSSKGISLPKRVVLREIFFMLLGKADS